MKCKEFLDQVDVKIQCSSLLRQTAISSFCMGTSFAAILGGGLLTLFLVIILFIWFFKSQCKDTPRNSDSGSSAPSAVVEMRRGGGSTGAPLGGGSQEARQFKMEELQKATRDFSETNLIGVGSFGMAFKGLLCDGTVVAIKRHSGPPRDEFTHEVTYLSRTRHRNLVSLLGYCQESGYQMLIFEYLPNGSICNHLYDTGKDMLKLEFKQRLSVGIGAAKGLCYLHGQNPPVLHGNFKTANVLVDENFTVKVADAGISKLLEKIQDSSPSSSNYANVFRDPEMFQTGTFSEASDVYSFGVFLLELISGKEITNIGDAFQSNESIVHWVERQLNSNDLVDHRLVGSFTEEGIREFMRVALQCMSFPGRFRPTMENVVSKLEQLLEKEIILTTVTGEGTSTVTLGSQLFTN